MASEYRNRLLASEPRLLWHGTSDFAVSTEGPTCSRLVRQARVTEILSIDSSHHGMLWKGWGGGPLILFILMCLLCLFVCLPAMMCMLCFWARRDISWQVSPWGMSSFFSVNTGGWHSVVNSSYKSQVDPTLHWIHYTLFLLCIIRNDSPTVSVTICRHGDNLLNSPRIGETCFYRWNYFTTMRWYFHLKTVRICTVCMYTL